MSDSQQKVEVILTFDDGPHQAGGNGNHTRKVKNVLNSNSCRAVFFIESHDKDPDTGRYRRGKHRNGTAVLKEVITSGHLVEVHTGYDRANAHNYTHKYRVHSPQGEWWQEGLPGDLERCKRFISSLDDDLDDVTHDPQFARPVGGAHNSAVRARYVDAGLELAMWDIDTRDWDDEGGRTPADIRNDLRRDIRSHIRMGIFQIVILFHDLQPNTRDGNNLQSYINEIKDAINTYDNPGDPGVDYSADLSPSKDRIREILKEKWTE